ncbi:MAG: anion permease [Proteobacteria bacterium]|nr:anion permease [Pseudomonadota bacterium]MBU1737171.1 anion permease [Pseudomonadota bacterium]
MKPDNNANGQSIVEILKSHPFFCRCDRLSLSRLIPHLQEKEHHPDECLYADCTHGEELYLILEGSLCLELENGTRNEITGGLLGEETSIGKKRYSGTATFTSKSRVIVFPVAPFKKFLEENAFLKDDITRSYIHKLSPIENHTPYEDDSFSPPNAIHNSALVQTLGWILATILPLCTVYFLRNDPTVPNDQALYLIAVVSCVGIMWMFQLLPDFIPALFAVLITILLGLAPTETILSGFASKSFFMALSILGLSAVLMASGLGYRLLLLLLKSGPANKWWYNTCVFIMGFILTPLVPTANGRIAIVAPFVSELLTLYDAKTARREAARLTVSVLTGAGLFSAIFLSSKSINFIIYGTLPMQEQARFQWMYWFYAASVCGGIMMVLYQIGFALLFRTPGTANIPRKSIRDQLAILGPLNKGEWAAIAGFVVLVTSFATNSLHRIEVPWVALAIFFALLMYGFIDKEKFRKHIDWSFLVFLASLIGLVASMKHTGVDKWLTGQFSWLNVIMAEDFHIFIAMLALAIGAVRFILPINATVIIFATLLLPTAENIGVNPWLVGFLILFMSESFILPYQASYYTQYCSITGTGHPHDDKRLLPFYLAIIVMKLIAIYASLPFWKHLGLL